MPAPLSPASPLLLDRIFWFALKLFLGFAILAIALMAGLAFAQEPSAAAPPAVADPVWLKLVLGLAPWVIGLLLGLHPALKLGAWLHADAKKRTGVVAALEDTAGIVADDVDAYLNKNGQSLKDLVDPAKRAAAEEALLADAKVEAKQAVDDALKRAL